MDKVGVFLGVLSVWIVVVTLLAPNQTSRRVREGAVLFSFFVSLVSLIFLFRNIYMDVPIDHKIMPGYAKFLFSQIPFLNFLIFFLLFRKE